MTSIPFLFACLGLFAASSVFAENQPPVISAVSIGQCKEGVSVSVKVLVSDAEGDPLTFKLIQAPLGLTIDNQGVVTWVPEYNTAGRQTIKIQVSDGKNTIDKTFGVFVENTNTKPQFISHPLTAVEENNAYAYGVAVADLDGDKLKLSLKQAPEGMTLENDILSWFPDHKSADTYPIVLEVTDGELSTTQSFSLTVKDINRLPKIESSPLLIAAESIPYEYQVIASDEDEEDVLKMQLKTAPVGMTISNGLIQWSVGFNQKGKQKVQLSVSDGKAEVLQDFTLEVINSNREPILAPIKQQKIVAGDKFKYQLIVSDPDGDKVKTKLVYAPKNMTIDPETNEIIWRTEDSDVGKITVIVGASDGDLDVKKHFEINVTADD